MKRLPNLFPLVCLILSACLPPIPQPIDPLAIAPPEKPYKGMALGLMISENTYKSLEFARTAKTWGQISDLDPDRLILSVTDVLKRDFKSVARVRRLEEASQASLDLVGILDMQALHAHPLAAYYPLNFVPFYAFANGLKTAQSLTVDNGMIFLTPGSRRIDSVRVVTAREVAVGPRSWGVAIQDVYTRSYRELEEALLASESLRRYAKAVADKGLAAAAAGLPEAFRSDVDRPQYRLDTEEHDFAVVVGVENYENLEAARFAERDAAAVREHLLALGYPQRNLVYLTGERAGRAGIDKYLESWLAERVKPDSRVFFYFSGRGAPDLKTGEPYLLPWDGDPGFLEKTGLPLKKVYQQLEALKVSRVLVALDAGFSGTGDRSALPKGTRPLVSKFDSAAPGKLVVLNASAPEEGVGPFPAQSHGLFTYHLLKTLQGKEGQASVQALYDALSPLVADAARREGRDQHPQLLNASAVATLR